MVVDHEVHEHWTNGKTFLIAAVASAVGIGNIWRFPYMAAENGGGSFILPYIFALAVIGFPVLILEFLVGSRLKRTPLTLFKKLVDKYYILSYIPLLFHFLVCTYYVVVVGWTLAYFLLSLNGINLPFTEFMQTDYSLYATLAVIGLLFVIMRAGVKNGLEKLNKHLVPVFLVCLGILFIGSISVYGINESLDEYLNLDPEFLFNSNTWTLAFTQAFFSLGVGWCIMLTYGSYINKKIDIVKSALVITSVDTLIALVAGFMVFTLAFGNGVPLSSGPSLAFDSLPLAINELPLAEIILPLFFLLLFSAALTSAASMLEVPATMIMDELNAKRSDAISYLIIILVLLSFPSALSYSVYGFEFLGHPFLDFLDEEFVGHFAPFAILVTVLLLGWGYPNLKYSAKELLPNFHKPFLLLIQYIIPLILIVISLTQVVELFF